MTYPITGAAWFEFSTVGLPEVVALAAAVTIAYVFGRRSRRPPDDPHAEQAQRDLETAAAIAQDLEGIAAEVHADLAAHRRSVVRFKAKVRAMHSGSLSASSKALNAEAERVLAPTLTLAGQLSYAYDRIRQRSTQLLAFTEVRIDALTGVGNRRALDEQLKLLFGLLNRYQRPFSIAIFDIDRFAEINERQGRAFGDQVLQRVANLFKESVRDTDFVARYGSEEFVVVMPHTRLPGAGVFGERLRGLVEQEVGHTVSGGLAEGTPEDDAQSLLNRADSALYSAKAAGRNAVYQHNGTTIRPVERHGSSERTASSATESGPEEEDAVSAAQFTPSPDTAELEPAPTN